jgi:rod shape determining protein RodA
MFRSFHIVSSPLFICALLIALIGIVNLHSATATFEAGAHLSSFVTAQLLYTLMGMIAMGILSRLSLRRLYDLAPFVYGFGILLLILVLIPGIGSRHQGAQSWLNLGFVRVQPTEFAKIALLCLLSRRLADMNLTQSMTLKDLVGPTLIFSVPTVLVILQNDLGSSLIFGLIFISLIFLQGVQWRFIVVALVLVVFLGTVTYRYFLKPYQKNRIVSFMEPERDPRGSGYHLVQSKIAVGSAGLWGKGYLKGEANKLKFLPERHTDFVFPVLAEEWGFVGATATLLIYFFFLLYGVNAASCAGNRFGFFLSLGLVAFFFWQMVINLGGVLGLLPLTGVPLPFLSYGGSSLVVTWMAVGLLLSVYRGRMG